jgi:hypothetical protein
VQRLLDGLVDDLRGQVQERADAGGSGRAQVRDVVDLVLVEADALDEVDLDLVAGRDAADQVRAADALVLSDGQDRGDVVTRVRVLLREEGVVEVELADRDAVGPGGPLRRDRVRQRQAEDGSARLHGVTLRLLAGVGGGTAAHGGGGDGRVVDDAVDDHVLDVRVDGDVVRGDLGDLPGELILAGQVLRALVGPDFVIDQLALLRRERWPLE